MIVFVLFGALAALFWYSYIKPLNHFKDKGVKQTNPWPVFGDMWMNVTRKISRVDLMKNIYKMYPNERYMGFFEYKKPALILRDPELIKQITVKDFDHFTDHGLTIDPETDPLLAGMLFVLNGQKWREMRATLSGAFTSSKMKTLFHLIDDAAKNFVQFFVNKNEDIIEVEMKDICSRLTNDVIATAAFGIQCDSLAKPKNEFYMMGKDVTNFGANSRIFRSICNMTMPGLFKLLKINLFSSELSTFFKGIINETIKIREDQGVVRPDMINLLLEARKGVKEDDRETIDTGFATVTESAYNGKVKKINNLTNELITSQALIFFIAGFDTVSTAMSFGSYELAVNKDVQDKLREEIKDTYKKNNGKITYEVLLKMKYMDMVVSEILRIRPPVTTVDRVCTKPYTIEPVNKGEVPVHLKPGDTLILPIQALQNDPNYYPNPEKFDPERFSDENKDSIKPYTYMPFGSGPRNCIGSRFALLEVKTMFFNLLLNFEIVPSKKTRIPLVIEKKSRQPTAEGGFWFALKRIKN